MATGGVYLVADGTGGEEASRVACEAFAEHLNTEALRPDRWAAHMTELVHRAHAEVLPLGGETLAGSTLSALVIHDGIATVAHVGDSRVYRYADGELVCLTRDHSVVQQLVDAGELDAEAMRTHPQRHLLTQIVGYGEVPEVFVHQEAVRDSGRYLLVTDGITQALEDDAIRAILASEPDSDRAVQQLIAAAAASDDNATAIVVEIR